jgi:peptidoglycan/xylan/chitin deacetylase (PgdA/CDA1 family)
MPRPIASLSLDLDNKWTYLKTHGELGWEEFPSYLDRVVPLSLATLAELGLSCTYFVVGQDAALPANRAAFEAIADSGQEIANHSFRHEPWLHLYPETELRQELASAEEHILAATGRMPCGFRGPGYSNSPLVLQLLAQRGYLYDASILPTFLGPLARAYYLATTRLSGEQRRQRARLFGRFRDGFRRLRPYVRQFPAGRILEMPVTTLPWLKTPIHFSYVLYLLTYSRSLARAYFRTALWACRLSRVQPSLLLHPLDFLGCDDEQDLSFFPAMNLPGALKRQFLTELLTMLREHFTVVSMQEHACAALGQDPTRCGQQPRPRGIPEASEV